jgi:hypothetical protein
MDVVDIWTGKLASLLRTALRLTNEEFAQHLGASVRNVAKWNSDPEVVPTPELQRALDTVLTQADEASRTRFARLQADTAKTATGQLHLEAAELRMANDPALSQLLGWIDDWAQWPPGSARRKVAEQLSHIDATAVRDLAHSRSKINRQTVAEELARYYSPCPPGYAAYSGIYGEKRLLTSILTRSDWLDLRLELGTEHEQAGLITQSGRHTAFDDVSVSAAVRRVAMAIAVGSKIVNSALYRLHSAVVSASELSFTFGLTEFIAYALTTDLLESELIDALVQGLPLAPANLPLRQRYLPTADSVVDVSGRLCAGGSLALFAAARPKQRGRERDYVVLVQERSGQVLNAARQLAVIPKSFHQPLVDFSDDTRISASLHRELEEELFGRQDMDSTLGGGMHADPLHLSRLSQPMRWLIENPEHERWRMECTSFGFNLVSGNYEVASLVVIDDEEWWNRFAGHIEANWESDRLQRYSTRDAATIGSLVHDGSWSNEGLFAFLQGLRRLAEVGGDRVSLPTITWEL